MSSVETNDDSRATTDQIRSGQHPGASVNEAISLPRTQQERSNATRTAVLDAAIHCLIERGYAATSTIAIQRNAGVSRGAMTHQFPSKSQLMIAAVSRLAQIRIGDIAERLDRERGSGDHVADVLRLIWEQTFNSDLFLAALELWTASRTDDALHAALQESERKLGGENRLKVARTLGDEISAHPNFPRAYEAVMCQMRGAVLTNLIRREERDRSAFLEECLRLFRSELAQPRP